MILSHFKFEISKDIISMSVRPQEYYFINDEYIQLFVKTILEVLSPIRVEYKTPINS